MRKLSFLLVAAILMFAGCKKTEKEAIVRLHVNNFEISQEEFPTKSGVDDYANLKALTLAFYKSDGTETYKYTQYKNDATTFTTFGEFSTTLPMGTYTMVVLGYGQESSGSHEVTLTSPTTAAFDDFVRETFAATQDVTVSSNTPLDLTATLNRIISKVSVVSTDGKTADVHSIRTTFGGGSKSFDPTTGLATDDNGFANVVVPSAAVGSTTNINSGVFLYTDEETMDITVETLDVDGNVIFSETVPDVPLKRNRVTTLTGAMYSAGTSVGSFQVNTDWYEGNSVPF